MTRDLELESSTSSSRVRTCIPSSMPRQYAIMSAWREMTAADINGVLAVANKIHTTLPERDVVFAERARLFPEGCLVLVDDGEVVGYAISHPIRFRQPPALDSFVHEIAADANQYYIHDLAILPGSRARGLAADCVWKLLNVAKRYQTTCLISVYGTVTFWARYQFEPDTVDNALAEKLREYGADARYLCRQNDEHSVAR